MTYSNKSNTDLATVHSSGRQQVLEDFEIARDSGGAASGIAAESLGSAVTRRPFVLEATLK